MKVFVAVVLALLLSLLPRAAHGEPGQQDGQSRGVTVVTESGREVELYSNSYALLIGNGEYEHWDSLDWPGRDVDAIANTLRELGFQAEVHKDLSDDTFRDVTARFQATRGREEAAQLLVYYAGHGHTAVGAANRSFGYVAMANSPDPRQDFAGFRASAISMDWFVNYARELRARHVLFVFDSCFSGSVSHHRL